MNDQKIYEVRESACRPRDGVRVASTKTFSVGVGVAGSRSAAVYRVKGDVHDHVQVDALASRLVRWLNDSCRVDGFPGALPYASDESAKIVLTASGRKAGFLPAGGW